MNPTPEQLNLTGLEDFQRKAASEYPPWFNDLRAKSLSRLKTIGIPTVKDEEWKYTNLAPLKERPLQFPKTNQLKETNEFNEYSDENDLNVIFVNGIFSAELSNLKDIPSGIEVLNLAQAAKTYEKDIKELFNRYDFNQQDVLIALNHALTVDGCFIKVNPKIIVEKLIHIIHVTSVAPDAILSPRTVILCGQSSEIKILESHISFSDICYFVNATTDIHLQPDAKLIFCKAQKDSLEAYHVETTRIWQERDSQVNTFSFATGALLSRNNLNITLNGTGSHSTLNGLYTVKAKQHVDNHTAVDHRPPNCTSTQLYKGILNDSSRAVFNGKIFVKKEAQQTNSYQLNKNLLLGTDCRVDTKPQLEIFADNVKCTHGATIGQLNEDELFYLESRSIPKVKAVKMLSRGFVDDIISTIPSDAITQKLNYLLRDSFAVLD